jgi:adenylate cyclase
MSEERARRKLSAILSADAVGYSRLMQKDEESTIHTLADSKELMAGLIQRYHGRVVDAPGDNLLAEFGSVVDAVECAVSIQQELKEKNKDLPENRRMDFRIGVNLGDVVEEAERIYGDGVNIASRLEGLAEPGGICVSGSVYDQIENKLAMGCENLGEHRVKNITKPVRVYRVGVERGEQRFPEYREMGVPGESFTLPEKPSIAVLPFDNLSRDPEQEYLADGMTENIIAVLSTVPAMFVIARNSTFTYKGKPVKVQRVAEDLGVQYVLEGSVQMSAARVRVTAQLIDAIRGHHLWADRYDRDFQDVFALQDEITLKILTALQVKLTHGQEAYMHETTGNLEALCESDQFF